MKVRPSAERGHFDHGWLNTYHTFSFADYYDPEHVDFGPLKVMNEDRIRPGKGYSQQRQDTEVLTYLIEGELRHQDSLGNEVMLRAGGLQCMSAGAGLNHSEHNPSASQETHLLHICVAPATAGLAPSYAQRHFSPEEKRGTLRLLASPDGQDGSLSINQDARLYGGLFHESQRLEFESGNGRRAFLHVVRGSIALNETRLNAGDGVKITPAEGIVLQHGRDAEVIIFDVPGEVAPAKRKPVPRPKSKSTE
ncbi:MAG TPA: pirin family protein [Steroidobacteraceae bacterium]|nr:pirin family protein [Steroidobacteraceae bacterium]